MSPAERTAADAAERGARSPKPPGTFAVEVLEHAHPPPFALHRLVSPGRLE